MSEVQVGQKSYEMPPKEGFTVAHFLTVADVERSLRFYEKVFGGRIDSRGDKSGAPGYLQIANTWLIVNPGGGPTPDKPATTLRVPPDPDQVSSFMNIRVADIQACYKVWKSLGAEFITEPRTSTARPAATSAIPTATSSRSARANPSSPTARRPRLRVEGHGHD